MSSKALQYRAGSTPLIINDNDNDDDENCLLYQSSFFNINQALDYTCSRLNNFSNNKKDNFYCGQCDTCQINKNLIDCKQWFKRASHLTIKNFVLDLVKCIQLKSIYQHLNNLLKISIDSKEFIYSRNKLVPSISDDYLIISNDRCSDKTAIEESSRNIINWYKNSSYYIKLNFMIGLLKECEQSIIYMAILQIKTILEAPRSLSAFMNDANINNNSNLNTPLDFNDRFSNKNSNNNSRTGYNRVIVTSNSDYDDLIFNENISSGEDDCSFNGDFDITALYANVRVLRKAKHVDFIRQLPVHLSKLILNNLNKKTLYNCMFVSKYWYNIVKETRKNANLNQVLLDDMMLLRGTTSKICNPKYANDMDVKVPNLISGTFKVILNENEEQIQQKNKTHFNWVDAYKGISTRFVILEERNIFCGSYNVLLLKEKRDSHRVVSLNGQKLVALGSFDKKIRFIDIKTAEDIKMTIQGHAGSIKCIYISENLNIVFTGSYDTSIRCWSLKTGKCLRIFQGHQGTVTSLSFCEETERLVTGSYDKTCRVWSLKSRINQRVFKHNYPISTVAVTNEDICISGGYKGKIKVFQISTGVTIKVISVHTGMITGIKFDKWHIITTSTDGYALAFSGQGNHKKCLMAMRHPKAVLCVEFQFLRAITGSADGKIRIWNILNGDCLRVMRGNSQCDPVLSLSISHNRMLINTEFNVLLMEFESVVYEYGSKRELDSENLMLSSRSSDAKKSKLKRPYSTIRANRSELVGTPNVKLFNDERKSIMRHSSGPISEKTLQEAKFIQQPQRSSLSNSKLSIVTVNTPMTFNTLSASSSAAYQKSTLSYVNVQSKINLNNVKPNDINTNNNTSNEEGINLDLQHIDQDEANLLKYKKLTLDETKVLLRNQLKNMRKSANVIHEKRATLNATPTSTITKTSLNNNNTTNYKLDTISCIETSLVNRNQNLTDIENKKPIMEYKRPASSPGFYDTKTKLKLNSDEFQQFLNVENNEEQLGKIDSRVGTAKLNESTSKTKPIIVKTAVTKLFETQQINLKTNNGMYPPNVNSKLPNPKVVSVKRPVSSFEDRNNNEFKIVLSENESNTKQQQNLSSLQRSNTSVDNKQRPPLMMTNHRPPIPKRSQIKPNQVIENYETNKILSGDNLKLMTHKEVDEIMNRINVLFDASQVKKRKEEEKTYKKLWLLRSNGVYHGSLLEKQKSLAPEIRE